MEDRREKRRVEEQSHNSLDSTWEVGFKGSMLIPKRVDYHDEKFCRRATGSGLSCQTVGSLAGNVYF